MAASRIQEWHAIGVRYVPPRADCHGFYTHQCERCGRIRTIKVTSEPSRLCQDCRPREACPDCGRMVFPGSPMVSHRKTHTGQKVPVETVTRGGAKRYAKKFRAAMQAFGYTQAVEVMDDFLDWLDNPNEWETGDGEDGVDD